MLSIRNGFGITPNGPMGPFPPKGAEGALRSPWPPWVPLGPLPLGSFGSPWPPLGHPWVPLGPIPLVPLGPLPSQGSRSSRGDKRASQSLAGGAYIAGENILGRRHARKRIRYLFVFSCFLFRFVLLRCIMAFVSHCLCVCLVIYVFVCSL